eukprot:CAMPEP_0113303288 /NCGR_PEP_ID=MMETSP0010_2-20120614/3766_1 /TAXON_ID=216773 ORGANISM="Corethron hystrix, Strain 308" /NCGR_SAMPLE_ID=MMETSP0010_2 /ASSEMBLY_ACC=CAM_ASM_000155 /LENGTH=254 /DNA_ID=CAMNT_0000157259 /DNA_START=10 /DNA_END=774 /DNA_ORIENTATION=+ /assembly_acc=CAM_ASM_000155
MTKTVIASTYLPLSLYLKVFVFLAISIVILPEGSDGFLSHKYNELRSSTSWRHSGGNGSLFMAWGPGGKRVIRRPDNAKGEDSNDNKMKQLPPASSSPHILSGPTKGNTPENLKDVVHGSDGGRSTSRGDVDSEPTEGERLSHPLGFVGSSKLRLKFTCNLCDGRSTYDVSRVAYASGLVICQCRVCGAKHLIADHVDLSSNINDGGFGGAGTIEEFLKMTDRAHQFRRVTKDVWTLEDLYESSPHACTDADEQ